MINGGLSIYEVVNIYIKVILGKTPRALSCDTLMILKTSPHKYSSFDAPRQKILNIP